MSDAYLVRRGGSGGLSANAAVLHVKAPAGSTNNAPSPNAQKGAQEGLFTGQNEPDNKNADY